MLEEKIENITKRDSKFSSTFVDDHVLPDINFNGNCLISNKSIHFLHAKLAKWLGN